MLFLLVRGADNPSLLQGKRAGKAISSIRRENFFTLSPLRVEIELQGPTVVQA
jgi:hypothetical protein